MSTGEQNTSLWESALGTSQLLSETWDPSLVQVSGAGQEGNDLCRHDPARMARFPNEDKQGEDLPLSPGCSVSLRRHRACLILRGSLANISQGILHIQNSDKLLLFN